MIADELPLVYYYIWNIHLRLIGHLSQDQADDRQLSRPHITLLPWSSFMRSSINLRMAALQKPLASQSKLSILRAWRSFSRLSLYIRFSSYYHHAAAQRSFSRGAGYLGCNRCSCSKKDHANHHRFDDTMGNRLRTFALSWSVNYYLCLSADGSRRWTAMPVSQPDFIHIKRLLLISVKYADLYLRPPLMARAILLLPPVLLTLLLTPLLSHKFLQGVLSWHAHHLHSVSYALYYSYFRPLA